MDIIKVKSDEFSFLPKFTIRRLFGLRVGTLWFLWTKLVIGIGSKDWNGLWKSFRLMYPKKSATELRSLMYDVASGNKFKEEMAKYKAGPVSLLRFMDFETVDIESVLKERKSIEEELRISGDTTKSIDHQKNVDVNGKIVG